MGNNRARDTFYATFRSDDEREGKRNCVCVCVGCSQGRLLDFLMQSRAHYSPSDLLGALN